MKKTRYQTHPSSHRLLLKIPLLICLAFMLSSFIMLPWMVLTGDSGLFYMVNELHLADEPFESRSLNFIVNLPLILLFHYLYLKPRMQEGLTILLGFLSFMFIFSFVYFFFYDFRLFDCLPDYLPYMLKEMLVLIPLSGALFIGLAFLVHRFRPTRSNLSKNLTCF